MADPTSAATPAPPPTGEPAPDWTSQAADTVEAVVLAVKQKTTVPLTTIARAVVYGVVIATLGTAALVMLVIAAVRVLVVYVPVGTVHGHRRVWIVDVTLGLLFTLAGLYAWSKRAAKESR